MKVLVVGSGGREHALCWKLKRSRHCSQLFCAPGNPGIAALATCLPIQADDIAGLAAFAEDLKIELTVVGPEAPLAAGIVDVFQQRGLPIFGPTRAAAQLEASKAFAKTIMRKAGVPTAKAHRCRDVASALAALDEFSPPYVVKVDGLAAGKGVSVCATRAEAEDAVRAALERKVFGDAGSLVLVEECLVGEELSVFALSDGRDVLPMTPAQDHKRALDGDRGPNTGGMGAYSPVPHLPDVLAETTERILRPTVAAMAEQGTPYRGLLYAGLMLTPDGLKVIEFNCRFGDPETQVVLPRLDEDLLILMLECIGTGLARSALRTTADAAVCVVAASGGYPGTYRTGLPIAGLDAAEASGALIFHAGTIMKDGTLRTGGGRVLNVVGLGADVAGAAERAYAALRKIGFEGMHYRRDIGHRALRKGPCA
jgi:phosphoribosylamine--glycine ligase